MPLFSKPLPQVTPQDIETIVSDQVQEDDLVEFKNQPPCNKGLDQWMQNQERIGDYARNKLIEEIIAFANSHGGTLVIGISESDDKPHRAKAINLIPKCIEFADRFRLQCRDIVDPQIPFINIIGIPFKQDGSGVIVVQVDKSRLAPHRHSVTRECYVRRADRTEKMTMREIQDLTLNINRGMDSVEKIFHAKKELFYKNFIEFKDKNLRAKKHQNNFAIRLTATPLMPVYIERVHNIKEIKPINYSYPANIQTLNYELSMPSLAYMSWKPILRGSFGVSDDIDRKLTMEINCDGSLEFCYFQNNANEHFILYPEWVMCLLANILVSTDKLRSFAKIDAMEYGLEIEVIASSILKIGLYGSHPLDGTIGPLPAGNTIFPKYSIGNKDEFIKLCNLVEKDFWNASGHASDNDKLLNINFNEKTE